MNDLDQARLWVDAEELDHPRSRGGELDIGIAQPLVG
jgi:hypothetical protein